MLCLKKGKRWAKRHANCWSPLRLPQPSTPCPSPDESFQATKKRNLILQHHLAAPEGTCGLFSSLSEAEEEEAAWSLSGATMAPSPPPTGLLHQNSSTSVLGALPSRLVTEDTPPDMLAGSMDLRVTLPNGQTVKMSVERSTPMMDLLVHITTAHKVSPGGHVLQAMGERGVLPYKPSTPIGALDTWSIRVVPRHQIINTPQQQQQGLGVNKRAPPKPLALQPTQPFEQTFRLQVRLPRNQLYVSRISPRTSLAEILAQVCRDKNLDSSKYELRHPVNTEQSLQLSLTLADYRVTEVALVVRGSRAATELSSSDLPALQSRSDEPTSGDVRTQRASNSGSTASTGSATGIFGAMLKRSRSGGTTEGSLSGDSLGGRSSSPARSDESLSRSISPPASRPPGQTTSQMQPPPPPRHRKGRAPKPPPQAAVSVNNVNNKDGASGDQGEDRTLVISHSRNSSDSSGYHEASVLSESPENHARHPDSPSNTLNREKKSGSKAAKSQAKQFSRSMTNIPSEASTSNSKQSPALQKISNTHSISTTSLAGKKKRAPAPPPPRIPETQPSSVSHPEREETAVVALPSSNSVLEKDSTEERSLLTNGHDCVEEDDSLGEEELDSAFQSVTDVLEEQIRTEAAASKIFNDQEKIVQEDIAAAMDEEKKILKQKEEEDAKLVQAEEEARLMQEEENFRLEEEARLRQEQDYRIALEEQIRNEKLLRAEAERREAELERKRIEEERARLAEEREELARQRREQRELEKQLRERLEQELREKQQALQEEQRREIERLQKEQEELEKELREKEKEKAERLRVNQPPQQPHVIEEIVDWEYKLPAPPSAFRDTQVDVEISDNNIESAGLERRISSGSSSSELQNEVETKNKLNAMIETEDYIDNDVEIRPKPPEVVELRVKKSVTSEAQQRSLSPPRVSVVPLRSAHSLYSLVHMEDETTNKSSTESVQPMRKTSSVADVSSSSDDEARLQHLQQQFVQWQQQLITNQSVLQGHVSMPLQSLQVLREILPQMKQKLSEESNESNAETIIRSSTLPRPQRTAEISTEPTPSVAATLDRRSAPIATPVQRFRPPTVNLGTWSERPKSEVSIKQDSDYRIGVGQHQYTAARAPVVRSAEPKLKDTTNLIAGGAINRDVVARSNSWRSAPIQSSNKSSMVIIQNMNSANATEQVRASNKPTVILRHQPISLTDMQPQRRYTTLIGVNGAPQPAAKSNGYQQRTSTSITQATNPVVKGFKLLMDQTPAPPPPPPVIRNITQKRSSSSMPTNDGPDTRDRLMDAIRSFGGRSNLRKIGSPNNLIYQS